MKTAHSYAYRYSIEEWGEPAEWSYTLQAGNHLIRTTNDGYGYADDVLVASIMRDLDTNGIADILLLSPGADPAKPSREILEAVRDQINHYLECHCNDP